MGKRSKFKRMPRDLYRTFDPRALQALAPHLAADTQFIEPCAGAYDLAAQLVAAGHICMDASDLVPLVPGVRQADALKMKPQRYPIITNPPWRRDLMHAMIMHFMQIAPEVWLLFDSNWQHTDQARPHLEHCTDIVVAGRLLWIPDTTMRGKEDVSWFRFQQGGKPEGIRFWPKR